MGLLTSEGDYKLQFCKILLQVTICYFDNLIKTGLLFYRFQILVGTASSCDPAQHMAAGDEDDAKKPNA